MYRRNNYSFVIEPSYSPMSMQEMLTPFMMYKDAYEKSEEAYNELSSQSDKFKYLSETLPEGSKARQLYEGYANELSSQAEDLARNGLSMGNRRALTNLRRRYQGEIGRLVSADAAMQEEKKLRRTMNAKDSSMLYATDNMSIDDFLDGATPNLYNVSGNDLYTRGAAAGKSASSRVYQAGDEGSTLGGYYRKWVERNGYNADSINAFRANASAIPELQKAADDILAEKGVLDNLSGVNLERARQSVLNGIIDGAVYQEKINPVRDPGVMSAAERASDSRARQSLQLQRDKLEYEKATSGITINEDGTVTYDPSKDASYQRMKKLAESGGLGGDYVIDPVSGKPKKKTLTDEEKKDRAEVKEKGKALMKLDQGQLANNNGFDVTFGDNRHHYNYIGAISKHGNKWHHGAIDEDNPGHNFPGAWGWASTSNVENMWGNFSAEGSDSRKLGFSGHAKMRVLSEDEITQLTKEQGIWDAIEARCKAAEIDPTTADIQIIEVPNEIGGGDQKGYLIAVH